MTENTTPVQAQSQTIELPAGRFHYLSWGAEHTDRPAAVLLHGITSSAASWVRVGPGLAAEQYRVYALDMRGHGDSPKPEDGYTLRATADDVQSFIAALDLKKPLLMGHSWGGATAIVLASGADSRQPVPTFSRIILEDPAVKMGHGDYESRAREYTKDIGRPAEVVRIELRTDNPDWTEADIEGKVDAIQKMSREAVFSVFRETHQQGSLLPLLARMPAPTLLVRADPAQHTTLPDPDWDEARRTLPAHSRAVQIDGAAHNIHRTRFDAFMREVNDFLTGSI